MNNITDVISTFINGLSLGGIYAIIALGYTMVYGIAKMLNFAHGDIIMVGGYTIFVVTLIEGLNPVLGVIIAVVAAIIVCAIFGFAMEKLAYKPLRGASPLAVLITAIGVSYFLQSLALKIFGSAPGYVVIGDDLGSVKLGAISIDAKTIITLACSIVIMVALSIFIKYSKVGRAMIAVSEDRSAAKLMGINVDNIITITFLIGASLAAVAGFFYLLKSPIIKNTSGSIPGIKAFTAAVIGGIGSIPGAMIGGLLLGVIEVFCNAFPAIQPYTDAIEFALLIVILLVLPNGLLGKTRREKV